MRATGNYLRLLPLCLLFLASPALGDDSGYVEVEIEYTAPFPGYLQIRDDVCRPRLDPDCERARIRLASRDCSRRNGERCREAEEFLDSSACIPGLLFEGRMSRGEKVRVSLCRSSAGFGNASMRNLDNGQLWTRYFLLKDGDTVKSP